jgi:hypothetical protein
MDSITHCRVVLSHDPWTTAPWLFSSASPVHSSFPKVTTPHERSESEEELKEASSSFVLLPHLGFRICLGFRYSDFGFRQDRRFSLSRRIHRSPGGQPGNQNARKHGFYSRLRTREELEWLPQVAQIDSLDEEIALLRVKIRSILANDPKNINVLLLALSHLATLVRTQKNISKGIRKNAAHYSSETVQQFLDRLNEENNDALEDPA